MSSRSVGLAQGGWSGDGGKGSLRGGEWARGCTLTRVEVALLMIRGACWTGECVGEHLLCLADNHRPLARSVCIYLVSNTVLSSPSPPRHCPLPLLSRSSVRVTRTMPSPTALSCTSAAPIAVHCHAPHLPIPLYGISQPSLRPSTRPYTPWHPLGSHAL